MALDHAPRRPDRRFGRSYAVAGSAREGFYFAPLDAPEMQRFFDALFRYQAKVDPGIAERYRFVARILDDPVLLTADGRPAPGLLVQVIGAQRRGGGRGPLRRPARALARRRPGARGRPEPLRRRGGPRRRRRAGARRRRLTGRGRRPP